MSRFGFFNEHLSGVWFISSAGRATLFGNMLARCLQESTVIKASYRDGRLIAYILNLRIVIPIAMNGFGFFDKILSC